MKLQLGLGLNFQFVSHNGPLPPIGNMTVVSKPADQTFSGSLADDSDLKLAIAAHETWAFFGSLYVSGDGQLQITGPTGSDGVIIFDCLDGTGTSKTVLNSPISPSGVSMITISGIITNGVTAGTIHLQGGHSDGDITIQKFSNIVFFEQ